MKKLAKTGLMLFVSLIIFTGGIFLYFQLTKLSIDKVLPEGPLIYLRFSDVQGDLKKFISTPFWKRFNDLNMDYLLENGILNEKQKALLEIVKKQLPTFAEHKMLKKMFEQEIAIAVYPPSLNAEGAADQLMENMLSKFFVVIRVKPQLQLAESLTPFVSLDSQKISLETKEYRQHRIHIISLENNAKIVFTRIKDLLIAGLSEETARVGIDIFEETKPSLADDLSFQEARKRTLRKGTVLAYLNVEGILSLLIEQIKAMSALNKGQLDIADLEIFFERLSGFKTITASARWDRLSQLKLDVWTDEEQIGAELKDFYDRCTPRLNKSLEFAPRDVLAYQWSECIDFKSQWERLTGEIIEKQGKAEEGMASSKLNNFEKILNLSIGKDILPLLEEEIGGYIRDINFTGPIPVPAVVLFTKITDQLKAENILKKILEHYNLPWQEEDYSGTSLKYIQFPLPVDVQPSFCFIGDYLLVGSKKQLLENAVDVYQKKFPRLPEDKALRELDKNFLEKNTGMIFMRVDHLSGGIGSIFKWADESLSSQDEQKEAFQKGGQRRLQDLRLDLAKKERELREMQEELSGLQDKMKEQRQNKEGIQAKTNQLQADIEIKQGDLDSVHQKEKELELVVQGYQKEQKQSKLREVYFEEILMPLLDDLKFFKSFGARTTRQGGVSESIFYLKLN